MGMKKVSQILFSAMGKDVQTLLICVNLFSDITGFNNILLPYDIAC